MSDYYNKSSNPANGAFGSSSIIRSEFAAIESGISAKLPPITSNGGKIVAVNAGETALEPINTTGTGNGVRATSPNITTPTGIVKADVGLGSVDNTADSEKPVSTAQALADAAVLVSANAHSDALVTSQDSPIRLNPRKITADLSVPSAYNASSVGPIAVADGVTVTVGDNATWSIH